MTPDATYTGDERSAMLDVARASISHGLNHGRALQVDLAGYSLALRDPRATFVTLHRRDELRGCIGTLEAYRPLIQDVAHHAYAAAFSDPRFAPVTYTELPQLQLHISVLTPARAMVFRSEEDLLQQLRPGIDGLIMEDGRRRGTFLPSVWESLPDARDFLRHLKRKAGLPENYWSPTLGVSRYETVVIG